MKRKVIMIMQGDEESYFGVAKADNDSWKMVWCQ